MKPKNAQMVMKGVGVALAVCSAVSMLEGCTMDCSAKSTRKMVKKAVTKVENIADTVMAFL